MKRVGSLGLLLVTSATLACSSATAPIASGRDAFGTNSLSSYDHYSDNGNPWQISPDTLKADGVGVQSVLIRKADGFLDGWVEVETKQVDDGGLVLRFLDNEHYYLLAIRDDAAPEPRGSENLEIYERAGPGAGGFQILWMKDILWPRGTTHRIRFAAVGSSMSVYVDDALAGTIQRAPAFAGAGFGIRHFGASADWHDRFHNFAWHGVAPGL